MGYTVHRMGQRNWSSLKYSNIYVPNGTFHVFYCTFCTFPIKTFYVSIAFSCHKIIFFSSGFGEINKKTTFFSKKKKKKNPLSQKKKKKKKKKVLALIPLL